MIEALQVEYRPIDQIAPYSRNAREHSDAQIGEIAASIQEFGFSNPILVGEDGVVIAGHGRLAAAQRLGMDQAPVIVLRGLSEVQRRQLVLADNRIAMSSGWNSEMLAAELVDLRDIGADLAVLGFSEDELAEAFASGGSGLTDPDEAPDLSAEAIGRLGDLWALGPHRLLCGDATSPEAVERVLGGVKPHLMVTDPPYGVEYDPQWRERYGLNNVRRGSVENDDKADWRDAWANFPGDVAYVWHGMLHSADVIESLVASGFAIRAEIVWDKTRLIIGRGDYHSQHESAWYAVRKGRVGHWSGDRKQTTVWPIQHLKSETGHGTQKPVECMRRPIVNNSSPGQAVYDPFLGSGTTLMAAQIEGRVCYGLEISPAYCDVIVKRWQDFTGEAATLEDGRRFAEVAAERMN